MAFDVLITGMTKDGETLLELNPVPWWDSDTLMDDDRFTVSNETGSYADFDADLNLHDMRALHEHFRPAATAGVY